jgi:deoxyribose-phosphate aldolase
VKAAQFGLPPDLAQAGFRAENYSLLKQRAQEQRVRVLLEQAEQIGLQAALLQARILRETERFLEHPPVSDSGFEH